MNEIIDDSSKDISPLTVGVCDGRIIYDLQVGNVFNNPDIDLIVWGIKAMLMH